MPHLSDPPARRTHASGSPFEASIGFSRAIRSGNRILVSGTAPVEADGSSTMGAADAQARRCFTLIQQAIEALGGSLKDVVRTRMFLTDAADAPAVGAVHGELFADVRPAATMIAGVVLLRPEWRVEIEAEAEVANG